MHGHTHTAGLSLRGLLPSPAPCTRLSDLALCPARSWSPVSPSCVSLSVGVLPFHLAPTARSPWWSGCWRDGGRGCPEAHALVNSVPGAASPGSPPVWPPGLPGPEQHPVPLAAFPGPMLCLSSPPRPPCLPAPGGAPRAPVPSCPRGCLTAEDRTVPSVSSPLTGRRAGSAEPSSVHPAPPGQAPTSVTLAFSPQRTEACPPPNGCGSC